jgi:hypothetical protein
MALPKKGIPNAKTTLHASEKAVNRYFDIINRTLMTGKE